MLLTRKSLSRRALLRGLGTAVALPALDAMLPAASAATAAPKRIAFVYVPNGIIMKHWTPAAEGAGFPLGATLEPLAGMRERFSLVGGLAQNGGRALGDGPGDHARAAASFLTGAHPRKTEGADINNGISVDQVAARAIGGSSKLPSLELGLEGGGLVGNCDSGYSCAYTNSISWSGPKTPLPPELNPRAVFERLFGDGELLDRTARLKLARQNRSLLDFVREDAASLRVQLGAADSAKLDEYLTGVREIERRIQNAERQDLSVQRETMQEATLAKPAGVPVTYEEYARLMFDLVTVAFQTDSTRVITFMMGREGSNRTYRAAGVPEAHHGLSHHMGNEEKIAKIASINRHHVSLFAHLLERLAAAKEGAGSLLDNTLVVYGSGLSDGNSHLHHDLPVLLAGGKWSGVPAGRYTRQTKETPLNNLFLSLLESMGVPADPFGDASGKLVLAAS